MHSGLGAVGVPARTGFRGVGWKSLEWVRKAWTVCFHQGPGTLVCQVEIARVGGGAAGITTGCHVCIRVRLLHLV